MGYLPCPRIRGTYKSSTVVQVVVGMVGTGRPLWVVGIRGSSPSVGTRGPLVFVGCGTGGGPSLSVVVNGHRRHSLGSWHHVWKSASMWHARVDRWRTTSASCWWHRWHRVLLDMTGGSCKKTHLWTETPSGTRPTPSRASNERANCRMEGELSKGSVERRA